MVRDLGDSICHAAANSAPLDQRGITMDIIQLAETPFQESLKNPSRPGQIGLDQIGAISFVFGYLLPLLNDGETFFYIYRATVKEELKKAGLPATDSLAAKVMKRLRKDFLILTKRQHGYATPDGKVASASAARYEVNPTYLELRPARASDLYKLWRKQDGHDVRYFSCLSWCWRTGKKATAKNLMAANELFLRGEIVKLKEVK